MNEGREYDAIADVYEWLVPDEVFGPQASVAAFASVIGLLGVGARVLDCACGVGDLAVGLAERGFAVSASDASAGMVARTRALSEQCGVVMDAAVCDWASLPDRVWPAPFDAVFCVGNSLMHAEGQAGRRAALAGMAGVLGPGGVLAITSRNWERLRAEAPRVQVTDRVVRRRGQAGVVVHVWTLAPGWDEEHSLEVAVALLGGGDEVEARTQRLPFWPYTHLDLGADLQAVGLEVASSTYSSEVSRYLVVARRPAPA